MTLEQDLKFLITDLNERIRRNKETMIKITTQIEETATIISSLEDLLSVKRDKNDDAPF